MASKDCPNCGKKLDGILSSRYILSKSLTDFINSQSNRTSEGYCSDCGVNEYNAITKDLESKKQELVKDIKKDLHLVPIITVPNSSHWEYDILEIVTGQSVTGTGLLTEIASSWADFLGGQSESLAGKILKGENICKEAIRFSCLLMGGNAIIGTDIDYSEVGGGKGMLMVCMSGTAIKVKNWAEKQIDFKEKINHLAENAAKLAEIKSIKIPSLL